MPAVTACATCGSANLVMVLDLGCQPLAERETGVTYPLAVLECSACGLAQLSWSVDREQVFPPDHPYATGNTRVLREHFAGLAAETASMLSAGDLIVDIGANDGTFLGTVRRLSPHARLLGIEPTGQARGCRARGVPVEQAFWSPELAAQTARSLGRAKVITACNVLAHAGDQHDFLAAVNELLAPGGTFITENHDWASVVGGLQVDTVYHEHLRYYTPASLGRLLAMHGLAIAKMTMIATHGGSFRTYATRLPPGLQDRADTARDELRRMMRRAASQGKVYGVGAATRATPLIWWAGIAPYLDRVVEVAGSAKIGSTIPGTDIPVTGEDDLVRDQPPHALLLAWHIADSVVPKLRAAGYEGTFLIPLPSPRVYRG